MEEKSEEKYLGDLISTDGKNMKNFKSRTEKNRGIVNKILTVLDGIPLGKHYFEVGMLLRSSLLVSSMLFNCEAWYNLTNSEFDLLESIDLQFLRYPKRDVIPGAIGCKPFREIIRERRLGFLYYILNEDPQSLIHKFFQTQLKNSSRGDWVTTVLSDLKCLILTKA